MKHAIINSDNLVVNIIIWPDGSFKAPRDHISIESDVAKLGDRYENGSFVSPSGVMRGA